MSLPALLMQSPIRTKVFEIEDMMRRMPQVDMPVAHYFSLGIYARELSIPAGTLLTGKIHKYQQLNIMTQGDLSVLTEDGIKRVQAGFVIVSPPGTKRIAYAHADTKWITVHATDKVDVAEIEQEFIAQSDAEYLEFVEAARLAGVITMLEQKS